MKPLSIVFALLLIANQGGDAKEWRNTDGSKSFNADFVSLVETKVTLRRADGNTITFDLSKLHPEDRSWIKKHESRKLQGSAFDTLNFGDRREQVGEKLRQSKFVTSNLDDKLLGRTGLNGVFKTKNKIGDRHCLLFFSWSKTNLLREVSLQTDPASSQQYFRLKETWSALIKLLRILHGEPTHSLPFPNVEDLQDGQILGTHLWRTEDGHSVLLGSARDLDSYKIIVRFTTEPITVIQTGGNPVPNGPVFPDPVE